jgi:hypothetical protein
MKGLLIYNMYKMNGTMVLILSVGVNEQSLSSSIVITYFWEAALKKIEGV